MGALATIDRQRGRIAQAESLFQRSIALGHGILSSQDLADLLANYGNLLHDTGDVDAAIVTKWRALCVRCNAVADDAPLAESTLRVVLSYAPEDNLGRWTMDLANFANCLIDKGDTALATRVCAAAIELVPPERRHGGTGEMPFLGTPDEMVSRVHARLSWLSSGA
jgi:tetratricopeptide (TPR) repeat protein